MSDAPGMHNSSLRIFKEFFNHRLGQFDIGDARVDQIIASVVGSEHPALPELSGVFLPLISRTHIGVNEDGAALGIGVTDRNSIVGKENEALARFCPLQAMQAGK